MSDALVFHKPWDIALRPQVQPRHLGPREVLVRIHMTGICGTDIGIVSGVYKAKPGVVIGHETAGVVAKIGGGVTSVQVGDRVAVDPTYYCGFCHTCRTNRPNHCAHKSDREAGVSCDGAFANFYTTTERFIYPISDRTSFEEATFSEPLSCVLTGLNQLRLRTDMRIVIFGAGPIGLLFAKALAARGAQGVLVEISPRRREMATALIAPQWRVDVPEALDDYCCDLVIETSGRALPQAIRMLSRGGQILQVALLSDTVEIHPASFADKSLSLVGSIDSIGSFSQAVHMIESKAIEVGDMVTSKIALENFSDGFAKVGLDIANRTRSYLRAEAIKVLLTTG